MSAVFKHSMPAIVKWVNLQRSKSWAFNQQTGRICTLSLGAVYNQSNKIRDGDEGIKYNWKIIS